MSEPRTASPFAVALAESMGEAVENYIGAELPGRFAVELGRVVVNGQSMVDPNSFAILCEWQFPNNVLANQTVGATGVPVAFAELGTILPELEIGLHFTTRALKPSPNAVIDGDKVIISCRGGQVAPGVDMDAEGNVVPGVTVFRTAIPIPAERLRSLVLGAKGIPIALESGFKGGKATLYIHKDALNTQDANG
jgi:hypothetical protein